MEKFTKHKGQVAVLSRSNIDTDQIIPKQFLKKITRTGYAGDLFFDWRYLPDGSPDPSFAINQPAYQKGSILMTGVNFGCGSSREHAVWALMEYGFRAVIAPQSTQAPAFADIFRTNAMKNGLLTITLPEKIWSQWVGLIEKQAPVEMTVDLEKQTLTLHAKEGALIQPFDFPPVAKKSFLQGLDEISQTLQYLPQIEAFENFRANSPRE